MRGVNRYHPQRSSTTLRRFLVLLTGDDRISGEEGGGGVGDSCVEAGEDTSLPTGATATGKDGCAGASRAAVAAGPCRRWRRHLLAVVTVSAGTGRLHNDGLAPGSVANDHVGL